MTMITIIAVPSFFTIFNRFSSQFTRGVAMAEMIQAAMCYCLCGELCPIMDDMSEHIEYVLNRI